MKYLCFRGMITSGIGRHVELHVPGREELQHAPSDWPKTFREGSLNIRVASDGYPSLFADRGLSNTVENLDRNCYPCTFEIAQGDFGNNLLTPIASMPKRGSGQVWRAVLTTKNHSIQCWVLRRYGSRVGEQLELLAENHLRSTYNLQDGDAATVCLTP